MPFNREDWTFVKNLGRGSNGVVKEYANKKDGERVAVKEFVLTENLVLSRSLIRELDFLYRLNHPNVLSAIDVGFENDDSSSTSEKFSVHSWIMIPLMSGNLRMFMDLATSNPGDRRYGFMERLKIIRKAAQGLEFLHINNVVHLDINLKNILYRDDGAVKITDFDAAINITSKKFHLKDFARNYTNGYQAPELLASNPLLTVNPDKNYLFTQGVDVFSFAITAMKFLYNFGLSPKGPEDDDFETVLLTIYYESGVLPKNFFGGIRPDVRARGLELLKPFADQEPFKGLFAKVSDSSGETGKDQWSYFLPERTGYFDEKMGVIQKRIYHKLLGYIHGGPKVRKSISFLLDDLFFGEVEERVVPAIVYHKPPYEIKFTPPIEKIDENGYKYTRTYTPELRKKAISFFERSCNMLEKEISNRQQVIFLAIDILDRLCSLYPMLVEDDPDHTGYLKAVFSLFAALSLLECCTSGVSYARWTVSTGEPKPNMSLRDRSVVYDSFVDYMIGIGEQLYRPSLSTLGILSVEDNRKFLYSTLCPTIVLGEPEVRVISEAQKPSTPKPPTPKPEEESSWWKIF